MSADRRNEDDDQPKKIAIARIELERISRRPEHPTDEEWPAELSETLSIVERKRMATEAALARVKGVQAKVSDEESSMEESSLVECFRQAQEAVITQQEESRKRASDQAIARVRASWPPEARTSSLPPVSPIVVRPSLPPVESQRTSFLPLSKVAGMVSQAMERALGEPKKTRDEAFRFIKHLVHRAEGRLKLKDKIRETINQPERVSAVITLVMEVNQLASLLRRLDDTSQNLEVDKNELAKCNPRNADKMRQELAKAEEDIHRIPSHPPVSMSQEAEITTDGMMPKSGLIKELYRLQKTPPEQVNAENFAPLFEQLDEHLKTLIEFVTKNVGLDAGYTLRVIMGFKKDMTEISRVTKMVAVQRVAVPQETSDRWRNGLRETTTVVSRMLAKIDTLYKPSYEDLIKILDYDALANELRAVQFELTHVENRIESGSSGEQSTWERVKKVLPGNRPSPGFKNHHQLEAERERLRGRATGIQGIMRLHMSLANRG